jgi:hypothetical protein
VPFSRFGDWTTLRWMRNNVGPVSELLLLLLLLSCLAPAASTQITTSSFWV